VPEATPSRYSWDGAGDVAGLTVTLAVQGQPLAPRQGVEGCLAGGGGLVAYNAPPWLEPDATALLPCLMGRIRTSEL
jgi:hypothetical protein